MRKACLCFWEDDGDDLGKLHLAQADKRWIWYGAVLLCALTVMATEIMYSYHFGKIEKENEKNMELVLSRIAAYAASATDDEYEEMAQSLRRDLIYSDFSRDKENFMEYIPNTAEICRLAPDTFPSQVYLLCTNTGMLYGLDIFEEGEETAGGELRGSRVSGGYDDVSEATLLITKTPAAKEGHARLERARGIVSIQRMKTLFCDDCIREILGAVDEYGLMNEFVIMDGKKKKFYPIEEGGLWIGDYQLDIKYEDQGYDISVTYKIQSKCGE